MKQAQIWQEFLNAADSQELWDRLLDAALDECFSAGPSVRGDIWMMFPDESTCDVYDFNNARRNEQCK